MKEQDHRQHIYLGEPDEDLIESLEPDQLVAEMDKPVPRMRLSSRAVVGLWALRVFLLAISGMVVYAFVAGVINTRQ
ncbi:MAG: hypothetical protein ACYDAL_13780 [Candidatus Dormibacteraceae bacterium]